MTASEETEQKLPEGYTIASLTFVLAALSWIGPFSIDTYLPSLPSISRSLGVSAAQVQQTMTAFLAFFAFMSLWHGAISDAYGRRRLTLICLSIFAAASLGCATSMNVHVLMFFRALQGATAGAGMVVGRAVVRDLFAGAPAQRLMSHVATIFTVAPIVAPVAGGYLQSWFGWRSIFILLILLSTFLLTASWRWLPETLPVDQRRRLEAKYLARSYWSVMTSPPFLLACASMGFTSAGFFIYIMGAPQFLMKHLHLHETQFLWLFGPMAVAMVVGAWISGYCAGRISGNKTIMFGYLVMAIAAVGNMTLNLLVPPMVPWTIVPLVFYVVGMSIAMPSLTLFTLDLFPRQKGLAASCQGAISLGANSAVSAFVPLIWGTTRSMAMTEIGMLIIGSIALLFYFPAMRRHQSANPIVED
ncbi:MAG TPA: multidrug effflux MFS transporter [Acidobacteriota bacterium]|nr:multidrug effflux MFS transporter [Acidobacteriota bacterium]